MLRKTLIATLAMFALAMPAQALTLEQAQGELADMYCSGSSCTSEETGSVTTTERVRTGSKSQSDNAVASDNCTMGVIGQPGVRIQTPNVDANCTPLSIASSGTGRTVTSTKANCTVTTKTLTYNGPFTARDGAWSIDTSSATNSGAC